MNKNLIIFCAELFKLRDLLKTISVLVGALTLMVFSTVGQTAELTVDEGVVIKFGSSSQLVVRDHIIAGKGIMLTSKNDNTAVGQLEPTVQLPLAGDWLGIQAV